MNTEPARDLIIPASDARPLGATLFLPADRTGPTVVLASGLGIRRHFYGRFAAELARHGYRVITFDYRGIGDSRAGPLRDDPACMRDWGEKDLAGILDWARRELRSRGLFVIGHSAGGQLMGLAPGAESLDGVVLVAVQSGYWGHWAGFRRPMMWLFWHGLLPGLTRLLGYFPGRVLGLWEDLPPGVARQWGSWGRDPDYLFAAAFGLPLEGYAAMTMPMLALSFGADAYAPEPSARAILRRYPAAAIDHRHIDPRGAGQRVGHFGFFRERSRETLWPLVIRWLDQF